MTSTSDYSILEDTEISTKSLRLEKNNLKQRIKYMKKLVNHKKCDVNYWNKNEKCYLEGRLMSRSEFEGEIEEMNLNVKDIDRELK